MEKIYSIRKGRTWLNVFRADGSRILTTINKAYLNKDGVWKTTSFLNPKRGDIQDLMEALRDYVEQETSIKMQRGLL